jgi:hypothetical protein
MFRIGTGIATTFLSLSMIAASIGDTSAQGSQRKAAPAAARPAPAARATPIARPAQAARPAQVARPIQAARRAQVARPTQAPLSARVRSPPTIRHAPAPPRSATAARRAPQIAATPRRPAPRVATPRARSAPAIQRGTAGQNRVVSPPARGTRGFAIRGASRATISGRNFSIWHDSHRVRRGGRWRTFVGLSTLGILRFGSAPYYPYAYIDAPAPYCQGLTEDGCQLQWQEVPTLEGPRVYQCVAYCPWQ